MTNSRFQRGFTLIELGMVIGVIGLLALGVLSLMSTVFRNADLKRVEADIGEITNAMSRHAAERGGRVAYKIYGQGPGWAMRGISTNNCSKTEFNVVGVQLRVPDLAHSNYTGRLGQIRKRNYPIWVHRLKIPTVALNQHTRVFINPYSKNSIGYDIQTDRSTACNPTPPPSSPYSIGLTRWRLLIYEIPADLEAPLRRFVHEIPGFSQFNYAAGTVTVTFDEHIN